jgi:hypothetical protein
MLPWLRGAIPIKSHFEQVHRVSFDHESNLLKTPFLASSLSKVGMGWLRISDNLSSTNTIVAFSLVLL